MVSAQWKIEEYEKALKEAMHKKIECKEQESPKKITARAVLGGEFFTIINGEITKAHKSTGWTKVKPAWFNEQEVTSE